MRFKSLLLPLCVAGLSCPASAQHQHHHSPEAAPSNALSKFGQVHFAISCNNPAQSDFDRGVALLHSFWYEEAQKQFTSAAAADHSCAMAYWGLAMTEWRPFWDGLPEERRKAGIAEIDKATVLHPKTDREHSYINALGVYLHSNPAQNVRAVTAYAAAMGKLHSTYHNDVDAQAFYGLALSTAAMFDSKDPIAADRKALAVLLPGFRAHPDHPGFAHYIIHTCDNPTLARQALPAAEKYAAIAPDSAHALHMPGHIFARLGMWQQDISANLASVNASETAAAQHLGGVAHELHAYEFLLYAYLQDGNDAAARKIYDYTNPLVDHLSKVPGIQNDGMYAFASYGQVEFPAIYHLERHEWKEVLAIPEAPHPIVSSTYFRLWARAIAAGHLRDAQAADKAVTDAQSIYKAVEAEGSPISAEIHATFLTMQAWQSYAHHQDADALKKIAQSANEQDRVGQAEVDIPAREMYADMLLAEAKPADALAQYKTDLTLSPNRFNGLAGAAEAAADTDDRQQAARFHKQLLDVTNGGSASRRPEIEIARAFLKTNTP